MYDNVDLPPERLESRISGIRGGLSVRTRGDNFFQYRFSPRHPLWKRSRWLSGLGNCSSNRAEIESVPRAAAPMSLSTARSKPMNSNSQRRSAGSRSSFQRTRMGPKKTPTEGWPISAASLSWPSWSALSSLPRLESLRNQLSQVRPTIYQGRSQDEFQERISSLQSRLDSLRLQYHDSYPDIIILREQLAELKKQRNAALADRENNGERSLEGNEIVNPLASGA